LGVLGLLSPFPSLTDDYKISYEHEVLGTVFGTSLVIQGDYLQYRQLWICRGEFASKHDQATEEELIRPEKLKEEGEEDCPICFEEMEDEDGTGTTTCHHRFHI